MGDDEVMNGFSDLDGTDTFGMHDGGEIGGDFGAFAMEDGAMEDSAIELGAMVQGSTLLESFSISNHLIELVLTSIHFPSYQIRSVAV